MIFINKSIFKMKKLLTNERFIMVMMCVAAMAVIVWMLLEGGCEAAAQMAVTVVAGHAGLGKHVSGGPLTTSMTEEVTPGLLRSEIDKRVTKIRPTATPVDQITRLAGARKCGSMEVEYYSVDTKPTETTLARGIDAGSVETLSGQMVWKVKPADDIVDVTETVLFPTLVKDDGTPGVEGYVVSKDEGGMLTMALIGVEKPIEADSGTKMVRMGRAAAELDVQTPQFQALPVKSKNLCQIFKVQVEQSTFQKIANKEVAWTFSDEEEVAIIDMRMGMEKNFMFGHRARLKNPRTHEDVMLTGGIWNQTDRTFELDAELTHGSIVELTRAAFTGHAGSKRKVLVAGSGLIERLNKLDYAKVVGAGEGYTRWGIDFSELRSKFGTLLVVHSEVMDQCGHEDDGMIIDPEYLTKYSHVPFHTERLDLKRSGQRNTEAVVVTEASCVVLRYPQSHLRVITKPRSQA